MRWVTADDDDAFADDSHLYLCLCCILWCLFSLEIPENNENKNNIKYENHIIKSRFYGSIIYHSIITTNICFYMTYL